MLIENTLWGERDKVQIAIDRLRQFEPTDGYYLAFSGGKDSITIYRLAELAGVAFDAHYHVTTVDPPELVKFIREHYPDVPRERPEMTMFQLILYKKWPPMRRQRYCCEWLKEKGGDGRFVILGNRWAESPRRRMKRRLVELCGQRNMRTVNPIIDWSDADVWEFIRQEELEYCGLYDEGFKRLGCVLCPIGGYPEREAERWPKIAKAYVKTFDKMLAIRRLEERGSKFETGQEVFDWWTRRHTKPAPQETRLFD